MYALRNNEARSCNRCCRGRAISIAYSEGVSVDLGVQHAMRKHRVKLSSATCPALCYFSTLSHKRHDFRGGMLNTECMFSFPLQLLSEIFIILKRTE